MPSHAWRLPSFAVLLCLFTLGLASRSQAQTVPLTMNYQGTVTDSTGTGLGTGTPVNRKIIFRLFDAATSGTRLWSEQQTVTISNGQFSVLLGTGIDAVYNGTTETPRLGLDTVFTSSGTGRYIELVVDNGDNTLNLSDVAITPRQQLTSTAYCFRARAADTIASSSDLTINPTAAAITGGSVATNYGIGYYGTGRLFNGTSIDGPVLYGFAGGALGSVNGATQATALRWNASGQVGIGTASLSGAVSSNKLVLQGDDATATPQQLLIRGNTSNTQQLLLGYNTTGNYGSLQAFSAAGTASSLLLNPSGGNVGLGTTSPGAKLHIFGNGITQATGSGGTAGFSYDDFSGTERGFIGNVGSAAAVGFSTTAGDLAVRATTGNLWLFSGNNTSTGIVVNTSNNVGIGVASPSAKLDVSGAVKATGTGGHSFNTGDTDGGMFSPGDGIITFNTNGTERMRLDPNGNVAIGTTNPSVPDSSCRLAVYGGDIISQGSSTTANNEIGIFNSAGAERAALCMSGGTANYSSSSVLGDAVLRSGGNLILQSGSAAAAIYINTSNNIGMGTTSPTQAKLVIATGGGTVPLTSTHGDLITAGAFSTSSTDNVVGNSIYATGNVLGFQFWAFSDARIKNIRGRSDSAADLRALAGIEVTDYTMKDTVTNGTRPYKKVIAQQVERIFPQAVHKGADVVPDIYARAVFKDGWIELKTDLKQGERVRLTDDTTTDVFEVLEVKKDKFRTAFKPAGKNIFVYGREVKDFRMVDYEAISMLNVSATQEIKKEKDAEVKALQGENDSLKQKLAAQDLRLAALEARDKARDAQDKARDTRLAAIEKLLESGGKAAVRTASLK